MMSSRASVPSGVTKIAVNIHFTNRTSGEVKVPIGSFSNSLFQPFCKVVVMGGREELFSLVKGISLLRTEWLPCHKGGSIS